MFDPYINYRRTNNEKVGGITNASDDSAARPAPQTIALMTNMEAAWRP